MEALDEIRAVLFGTARTIWQNLPPLTVRRIQPFRAVNGQPVQHNCITWLRDNATCGHRQWNHTRMISAMVRLHATIDRSRAPACRAGGRAPQDVRHIRPQRCICPLAQAARTRVSSTCSWSRHAAFVVLGSRAASPRQCHFTWPRPFPTTPPCLPSAAGCRGRPPCLPHGPARRRCGESAHRRASRRGW